MTTTTYSREISAYIECALWAGLDWKGEDASNPDPLDDNYGADDVSAEALEEITRDVADFCEANADDLEDIDPGQVGHDFYLTRNRHGAGFWDRGLGDIGDRLSEAARVYGTSELYAGDDGKLYLHG